MVTNLQLGGEVLVLDDNNLLCELCKAKIQAAQEAIAAVRKFQEVTGQHVPGLPALPPVIAPAPDPWAGRKGKELSREERKEKAKHLFQTGAHVPEKKPAGGKREKEPKPEHRTLNGTVVTAPHLLLPRKKITAAAERDIERVVKGTLSKADWVEKHGYSPSLLRKRLEMRGVMDPKSRTRDGYNLVPGYKAPSEKISDEDFELVLRGKVSVVELSKKYGIPGGTVYRLIAKYRTDKAAQPKPPARAPGRPKTGEEVPYAEKEFRDVLSGELSVADLARKHNVGPSTVTYHLKNWCEKNHLPWPPERETLKSRTQAEMKFSDDDVQAIVGEPKPAPANPPPILSELQRLAQGDA